MKKLIFLVVCVLIFTAVMFSVNAASGDISPAIDYYRSNTVLDKSGVLGSNVAFSRNDYLTAIGSNINFITVTVVPDPSEGKLVLNGVDVLPGQTIAAASLDYLVFIPAEGCEASAFTFRSQALGWESVDIKCTIRLQDGKNFSPILQSGSFRTYEKVTAEYDFDVFDADGDELTFIIDRYPVGGSIKIEDGAINYHPINGFTGEDKFTVYAIDPYGNRSASKEITITVSKNKSGIYFVDMENDPAHSAAINLAKNNIAAFIAEDNELYFMPEQAVSRIEFLVMLMSAKGVEANSELKTAVAFTDTDRLSQAKQAYLKTAVEKGIIENGTEFKPNETITRIEAAVWVSRILNLQPAKEVSMNDMEGKTDTVKIYASCVVDAGLFKMNSAMFEPDKALTKASAAVILNNVFNY